MKSKSYFWTLLVGVVFLTTWEVLVRTLGTSELVMPAPSRIADVLWKSLVNGYLWPHIWQTLVEVFWGILLGGLMGCVGGIVLGESKHLRSLLMPYVVLSQVIPKLALAPLFIVWFGFGVLPTVVMTALICFFPLLENTVTSMQQVDPQKLELFKMLRANRWQTLWRLKIPSGMPHILAGFRVALVLAWWVGLVRCAGLRFVCCRVGLVAGDRGGDWIDIVACDAEAGLSQIIWRRRGHDVWCARHSDTTVNCDGDVFSVD
jgi:NitT/TauT family transport system permease protein